MRGYDRPSFPIEPVGQFSNLEVERSLANTEGQTMDLPRSLVSRGAASKVLRTKNYWRGLERTPICSPKAIVMKYKKQLWLGDGLKLRNHIDLDSNS